MVGVAALLIQLMPSALAQKESQNTMQQAQSQCVSATTPPQCRDAVAACQTAVRVVEGLPLSAERDRTLDRLLGAWASCEDAQGRNADVEVLFRQQLALRKRLYGAEHPYLAESLNNLAVPLLRQGKAAEAEPLIRQALAIEQKFLGSEHLLIAHSLRNLAESLRHQHKYAEAEPYSRQALTLFRKLPSNENRALALSITQLATILHVQGKYAEADPLYRQALVIQQKLLGPEHLAVASTIAALADVGRSMGRYSEAEVLLRRVLGIRQKLLGADHLDIADTLTALGDVIDRIGMGRASEREGFFRQALNMYRNLLGSEHPAVARSLNNLAYSLASSGKGSEAEPLYRQALSIQMKLLGPEHLDIAQFLTNLALVVAQQDKLQDEETLHRQALAIRQKRLGPEHPDIARSLANLAGTVASQGRYGEAETLYRQSLTMLERCLGADHVDVATNRRKLALFLLVVSKQTEAAALLQQSVAIHERQLRMTVSETKIQSLIDQFRIEEQSVYGLLLEPEITGRIELALQLSLLRKGRAVEAGAAANRMLQRNMDNPGVAARYVAWNASREQHEALMFLGAGSLSQQEYMQQLRETQTIADQREHELAAALDGLDTVQPPPMKYIVSLVAKRLPPESVLLEVVWARPRLERKRWDVHILDRPHYVAMLLFPDQKMVSVDLGAVIELDSLISDLQAALASSTSEPTVPARKLYDAIFGKLVPHLAGHRDVFLSLSGTLNLIPFDALHDGKDYLLGRYRFHYLTSGRDLLRQPSLRKPSAPLLLANPDFGRADEPKESDAQPNLYRRLADLTLLPGTQQEATSLASLLAVKPLVNEHATETVVRQAHAPRILHIATHGLFLNDNDLPAAGLQTRSLSGFSDESLRAERSKMVGMVKAGLPGESGAMHRSALVLANAKQGRGRDTKEDGLLTAQEARSLDLDGTQLVVLSACETGKGAITPSQGVYGLRRAFWVAGAETLVTSLWRVSDDATGELMTLYYQKLLDPKQPGDKLGAMVESMQELRQRPGRSHPFYWAPFLVIGQTGALRAVE